MILWNVLISLLNSGHRYEITNKNNSLFKKFLKLHFFISRQNNMWKINIFYTDDDIDKTRVGVLYGITHGKE